MTRVWVIDASSIICVQELPRIVRPDVWAALEALADSDRLFFPDQVLDELDRADSDEALHWAKKVSPLALPMADLLPRAKRVLAKLPKLIDPQKVTAGRDQADPYVVANGIYRRDLGDDATIITDDYRPRPRKTSLSDAAGVFGLPSVTVKVFIVTEGIWDGIKGT